MEEFADSATLMFALLNPFLMSAYLIELIRVCSIREFAWILLRASAIALLLFLGFAAGGEAVFSELLQVRFEAFMIFGVIVFLVMGLRMTISGHIALIQLRGTPSQISGSIAIPFMTGPGTVSASVVIGSAMPFGLAVVAIVTAVGA